MPDHKKMYDELLVKHNRLKVRWGNEVLHRNELQERLADKNEEIEILNCRIEIYRPFNIDRLELIKN